MGLRKKTESRSSDGESLCIKDCKILTSNGAQEASILIKDGRIKKVGHSIPETTCDQLDAKGLLALPGLIDCHVHLRGLELSYKEDYTSGTAAAAAGGFTSVLDMPNTRPVTDSPSRLKEKMQSAKTKVLVNVGFHAAAVKETPEIEQMAAQGAFSLKLYMPDPISPFDVEMDDAVSGLLKTAAKSGIPVSVHAEESALLKDSAQARSYVDLARARPPEAESSAIVRILRLQKSAKCSIHFAHLTLPSSLTQIQESSSEAVSSEVTPHHLLLSEKDMKRLGWKAWMVPPLRSTGLRRRLLELVARGMASIVASDHAPHSLDEKQSGVSVSPPGIPGLETTLPLLLTLVQRRVLSVGRLVELLCSGPARLFGLTSKGTLAPGMDGDVVIVDLKRRSKINSEKFYSKAKYSPFDGYATTGGVAATVVAGKIVYEQGEIIARPGTGKVLRRNR